MISRAINASLEVSGKERNLVEGKFTAESKTKAVTNSLGIAVSSSGTTTNLDVSSSIGVGAELVSSWYEFSSRRLEEINPEVIGTKSAEKALAQRGAKSMEGEDLPLILSPFALWSVFGRGLVPALNARQVQDGKSYLTDSLGSEIASSELEITDTGILPGAFGSSIFDAEGVPSQETPLIKSGVMKSYLHDFYSSAKDEVRSTGNASRSSYRAIPTIGATNLVVSPGDSHLDEMISEMKKGVLCSFTFDRPNFVTGELSAMIMEGFLISDGEIKHALKNTLFGITMQDLLKRIIQVGSDVEQTENVISPSVLVESAKITSGK